MSVCVCVCVCVYIKEKTQILSVAELWFLCAALLHNVFYLCMNLKADSSDKNSK